MGILVYWSHKEDCYNAVTHLPKKSIHGLPVREAYDVLCDEVAGASPADEPVMIDHVDVYFAVEVNDDPTYATFDEGIVKTMRLGSKMKGG